MDTIFALATARGRAGIAVVRISGPGAIEAAVALCGDVPVPGRALRTIVAPDGEVVDQALVLTFAGAKSFTGEPVAELHLHGSPAVIGAVLGLLGARPGLRLARAGEFTQRALENGQLDLAQVEGLADLIDAETEAQRKQAMRVYSGGLGAVADIWRRNLIRAAALIEATIDFADEDVPVDVRPEVARLLKTTLDEMRRQVEGARIAERIRDGFEVAIVGAPNVGKSSLLNALAGREAAITSQTAGTTRDVIEVRMALEGLPVTLLDTAGLREAQDEIESIGIRRGMERAEQADLRIHLVLPGEGSGLAVRPGDVVAVCKGDLYPSDGLSVSSLVPGGTDHLVEALAMELSGRVDSGAVAIRERHRVALENAVGGLAVVLERVPDAVESADVLAEDLRAATRHVDSLVGRVDVEDILDDIFKSFCIGK